MQRREQGFCGLELQKLLQARFSRFHGFELLSWKKVESKLKASSKEAQRKLQGIMKQAESRFEASCEEANRNSLKLTGSSRSLKKIQNKLEGSLKNA